MARKLKIVGYNTKFDLSLKRAKMEVAAVERALQKGHSATPLPGQHKLGALAAAALELEVPRLSLKNRVGTPFATGTWQKLYGLQPNWNLERKLPFHVAERAVEPSHVTGHVAELVSAKDNTFTFGAAGDLHAGSKYCRWDVREALYKRFEEAGATCNIDTGNWIEGESRFNTYDVEARGIDEQCRLLAARHPRNVPTWAIWGDDHEGWYVQRDSINVGMYAESIMREAKHEWTNLGYLEAYVVLRNANSGKTATMAVLHPGGGSAYATSYATQKIVESLEGGEKPAVLLVGHYHKLLHSLTRNVWVIQTGCQQDQTPFLRKQKIEVHVGGSLIKLRQDPLTGSIISSTVELIRYFSKGITSGRWSRHGPVEPVPRV